MRQDDPKLIAIISYGTIVGWIVALILHRQQHSTLGAFHLRQTLGLYLTALLVSGIPLIGGILLIALFVLWVIGLIGAIKAERNTVPVVGVWYQHLLSSLA